MNQTNDGEGSWWLFLLAAFAILVLNFGEDNRPCGSETTAETKIRLDKISAFNNQLKNEAFYIAFSQDEKDCRDTINDTKAVSELKQFIATADEKTQQSEIGKARRLVGARQVLKELLATYTSEYKCIQSLAIPFYGMTDEMPHQSKHKDKAYINKLVEEMKKNRIQDASMFCANNWFIINIYYNNIL